MKITVFRLLLLGCVLSFVWGAAPAQTKSAGYHVLTQYKVGGEGGWDYLSVDSKARRVYLSRSSHVMVIDADTGAVVGDIAATAGAAGTRLWPRADQRATP